MARSVRFEPKRVQPDKSGRIALVVSGGPAAFHGRDLRVVKTLRTLSPGGDDIALIEFQPDDTGNIALRLRHQRLKGFPLGGKPIAVVNESAVPGYQAVPQLHHFTVHGERFHLPVPKVENGAARSFIHAPALHSHVTALHHVSPADSMSPADLVQLFHHPQRRERLPVYRATISIAEFEFD